MHSDDTLPRLPEDCTLSYIPSVAGETQQPVRVVVSQLSSWNVREGMSAGDQPTGPAVYKSPLESAPPTPPVTGPAYVLRKRIGIGGMGEVYDARQTSLKRIVAVKRIRLERLSNPELSPDILRKDFLRESLIAGILEHPNIIPVHDLGLDSQGEMLLAMKRVHGKAWDALLKEDFETLGSEELLQKHLPILIAVANAVSFAHSRGIVHRDLKPAQVLVGEFGEVLLVDWGLAMRLGETISGHGKEETAELDLPSPETASNPSGTPALMAPEQTMSDALKIGTWTDIYLLGGCLYFLLTGTYPHQAESGKASFRKATEGLIEPPALRAPDRHIPDDLAALALKALQPLPEERLQSAAEIVAGIQDYLTGAGRRRESAQITEKLDKEVAAWTAPEYADFAEALSRLELAKSLWSLNPRVAPMRESILERYARAALLAEDLLLARIQAGLLSDGSLRTKLLDNVAVALREMERQRRQRRVALRAVAALIIIVLVGGSVFIAALHKKNKETEEQRTIADQQRVVAEQRVKSSQDLVNFMLKDLADTLDLRNEHDQQISSTMTEQVLEFVGKLELQRDRPEVQLLHASFLDGLAKNFRFLGLPAQSMQMAQQSLEIRKKYAPNDKLAQTLALHELGAAYDDQDQPDKAEPVFREVLETRLKALGEADVQTVRAYHAVTVNLQKLGKFDESIRMGRKGVEAAMKAGAPSRRELSHMHAAVAGSMSMSGNPEDALGEFQKALDVAMQLEPRDAQLEMMINRNMGIVKANVGDRGEGEDQLRQSIEAYTKKFGPAHDDTISSWNLLYKSQFTDKNYTGALETATKLNEIIHKHLPNDHYKQALRASEMLHCHLQMKNWETARTFIDDMITTAPLYLAEDAWNRRVLESMMIECWENVGNQAVLDGTGRLIEMEQTGMDESIRVIGELQRKRVVAAQEVGDPVLIRAEIEENLKLILAYDEFAPEDAWYNMHLSIRWAGDTAATDKRFEEIQGLLGQMDEFSDKSDRPYLKDTGRLLLYRTYAEQSDGGKYTDDVIAKTADLIKKHDVNFYYENCLFKYDALFLMDCMRAVGNREPATPLVDKLIKEGTLRAEARAAWDTEQPVRLYEYIFSEDIRNEMR